MSLLLRSVWRYQRAENEANPSLNHASRYEPGCTPLPHHWWATAWARKNSSKPSRGVDANVVHERSIKPGNETPSKYGISVTKKWLKEHSPNRYAYSFKLFATSAATFSCIWL